MKQREFAAGAIEFETPGYVANIPAGSSGSGSVSVYAVIGQGGLLLVNVRRLMRISLALGDTRT